MSHWKFINYTLLYKVPELPKGCPKKNVPLENYYFRLVFSNYKTSYQYKYVYFANFW